MFVFFFILHFIFTVIHFLLWLLVLLCDFFSHLTGVQSFVVFDVTYAQLTFVGDVSFEFLFLLLLSKILFHHEITLHGHHLHIACHYLYSTMGILPMSVGSLLVPLRTHVLANLVNIYMCTWPVVLFVAANVDRSDCMHMALGALQR